MPEGNVAVRVLIDPIALTLNVAFADSTSVAFAMQLNSHNVRRETWENHREEHNMKHVE